MIDFSKINFAEVNVFYLRMDQPPGKKLIPRADVSFTTVQKPMDTERYLRYYRTVGAQFNWLDRLVMSKEELSKRINAANVHVHVMVIGQAESGLLELVEEPGYIELLYFGLFPEFMGKGLGKYFLDWSIHKAWSYNPTWIQLNTCELDHPNALPTYRKLGFKDYKTTTEQRRVLRNP
jgi:GNAT superfamily N-acetyltransferase